MSDHLLIKGLMCWRQLQLEPIEADMREASEDYFLASEGLSLIQRNPDFPWEAGVSEYLWEKLNVSAMRFVQLEQLHDELMAMDLAELIGAYKTTPKEGLWGSTKH